MKPRLAECGRVDQGLWKCASRCKARLLCPSVQHGGGCRSRAGQGRSGLGPQIDTECQTTRTWRWKRPTVMKGRWSAGRNTTTMCGMWLRLAKGRLELGRLPRGRANLSTYPRRRENSFYRRRETTMNSNKTSGKFVATGKICLRVQCLCMLVVNRRCFFMTSAQTLAMSQKTFFLTGRCFHGHSGLNPKTLVLNPKPNCSKITPFWGFFLKSACDTHVFLFCISRHPLCFFDVS